MAALNVRFEFLISQKTKNKQYGNKSAEKTHLNGNPAGIDGVLSEWPET